MPRPTPDHIQFVAKLMMAGAGVKVVEGIFMLVISRASSADSFLAGAWIGAGLWLWMASGIRNGRNWARITGTVFFGLASLGLLADLAVLSSHSDDHAASGVGGALDLLNWGIGLYVVILIWQKRSAGFFRPQTYGQVPPPGYSPQQGGWPPEPPSA
jgi:hypothetical protein